MKLNPHPKLNLLKFLFDHDGEMLCISSISKGLGAAHSLTSRYLRDLEKRGLVSFSSGDHYRQRRYVLLTDKGKQIIPHLDVYFRVFREVLG